MTDAASFIVFDSGFGGLSVVAAARARGLGGRLMYVADHAGFPYGARSDESVIARVGAAIAAAAAREPPACAVIACSTASTLALPSLRARWAFPIVGVVPAVKPAVAASATGLVSVLATQGTARRPYMRALIDEHAGGAQVTLAAAPRLAGFVEAHLRGAPLDQGALAQEIAPAFVTAPDGRRTDVVALGCTHYPLAQAALEAAAPWPVTWINPADAIARRVETVAPGLVSAPRPPAELYSTAPPQLTPALAERLAALGFAPGCAALALEAAQS